MLVEVLGLGGSMRKLILICSDMVGDRTLCLFCDGSLVFVLDEGLERMLKVESFGWCCVYLYFFYFFRFVVFCFLFWEVVMYELY